MGGEVCRRSHCVLWHRSRPWDGVKGRCGAGEGRWHAGEPQAARGGMQRGHPVPLCSLLSQAGWGWMPWGSEEMGSPARGCYGSISPALGCLHPSRVGSSCSVGSSLCHPFLPVPAGSGHLAVAAGSSVCAWPGSLPAHKDICAGSIPPTMDGWCHLSSPLFTTSPRTP